MSANTGGRTSVQRHHILLHFSATFLAIPFLDSFKNFLLIVFLLNMCFDCDFTSLSFHFTYSTGQLWLENDFESKHSGHLILMLPHEHLPTRLGCPCSRYPCPLGLLVTALQYSHCLINHWIVGAPTPLSSGHSQCRNPGPHPTFSKSTTTTAPCRSLQYIQYIFCTVQQVSL